MTRRTEGPASPSASASASAQVTASRVGRTP